MSAEGKKLAVGVFCADWRLHQTEVRIVEKVRDMIGAEVIDVMSLPGPDGVCKDGREADRDMLLASLKLLIGAHHPQMIVFVGHYNCAGNPVDDEEHDENVKDVLDFYHHELHFHGEMIALNAIRKSDTEWTLKEVARS